MKARVRSQRWVVRPCEDVKGSHRAKLLAGSIRPFPSRRITPRGVIAGFHSSNAFKHRHFITMCFVMIVTSGSTVPKCMHLGDLFGHVFLLD